MSKLTTSKEFQELCLLCRKGDLDAVEVLISTGVNVNQMDEWNYSPLILASICGHEQIVRYLLEKGSLVCDRDTFEGERCIYGLLNDKIRNILLGFDISKKANLPNQPFAAYLSALLKTDNDSDLETTSKTADILFQFSDKQGTLLKAHRFVLLARSPYFKHKLSLQWAKKLVITMSPGADPQVFEFILNYMYLVPCLGHLDHVDVSLVKKTCRNLQFLDLLLDISLIEAVPRDRSAPKIRLRNELQSRIENAARVHFVDLVKDIFLQKLTLQNDISSAEKLSLYNSSVFPDILAYIDTENGSKVYYPCHRAILCKAEYFLSMFSSPFQETQIFTHLLESNEYQLIDRNELQDRPHDIPMVCLTGISFSTLLETVLDFLYLDRAKIDPEWAIDVLLVSDILVIDKLKTAALVSLTKLSFDGGTHCSGVSIYDILRVGWQTRVHRLETFVLKEFANHLDQYISTPEFAQIVEESAKRIELRQETDSIELIDDIRFYLLDKYAIDAVRETHTEFYNVEDFVLYEQEMGQIDELLEKLDLEL